VSGRTALEERVSNSILTDLWRDLGQSVQCSRASVSAQGGHHFWKHVRPGTEGAACGTVKSASPRAGLSQFKSYQCHALAVRLCASVYT